MIPTSPSKGIEHRDGHELTTGCVYPAKGPTAQVVRGESCGEVLPCSPSTARVAEVDQPEMPDMLALSGDEEEVDQGRNPRTREPPVGMTKEGMRTHSLTRIPYSPACRCCVAGRRKDNHHHQRSGIQKMQDDLDSVNAHVSADYIFPKDAPGTKGCHSTRVARP